MLVFSTTERYSHAEFIIIHSGARMGCRIEATPLTITDILLNDYCITCNMYVHNYSPPPLSLFLSLTCASILIVSLELLPKVLHSSVAKLAIVLKEIAYSAFDLPGALYFSSPDLSPSRPYCVVDCVKGMLKSLATKGLTDEPFLGRSA